METQLIFIEGIPAILWGARTDKLFIAVHGDQSNKQDAPFPILAEEAAKQGFQTISFDLPEHGGRKNDPRPCTPPNCVEDLYKVMKYARGICDDISLFGCSMGAYFGMLAFRDAKIRQSLFLSPVVDMQRLIEGIMARFGISPEQLKHEGEIHTPFKTLYWDYYAYVLDHPVEWNKPTAILYGEKDNICAWKDIQDFSRRFGADVTVMENGEHYFHTEQQLTFFRQWLHSTIKR